MLKERTMRPIIIPVLRDVEWITGAIVVASNLLHVENSQDPVKITQDH